MESQPWGAEIGDAHGAGGLGLSGMGRGAGGVARPAPKGRFGMIGAMGTGANPVTSEQPFNTEAYAAHAENPFLKVRHAPLSTFSIDVDTASYANVRRFLRQGSAPPSEAVRIEELINYFSYEYPDPVGKVPFSVQTELSDCPWQPTHRLLRVGLKGKEIARTQQQPYNLVFLVDVSGSMAQSDKLPLLRRGLELLVRQMRPQDRIAIAVYAGASGLVLPSTSGNEQDEILRALHQLEAGGSTNGAEGIELAYQVAQQHFLKSGVNRVILATDGDFNVGTTSQGALVRLIEQKRKSGVFLTVLGFGQGNLKDSTLELLANKGNGNYAYIDSLREARKVLVNELGSTLLTIAKDVKIQVEFNPSRVGAYRLIGYENRLLAAQDFNDDKKDAGEIGAGHSVTALYELVPPGAVDSARSVDALKYQTGLAPSASAAHDELVTVKLRYKLPTTDISEKLVQVVKDQTTPFASASTAQRFSAAVAAFGLVLRRSEHKGNASFELARKLASSALGADPQGTRREFLVMLSEAERVDAGR